MKGYRTSNNTPKSLSLCTCVVEGPSGCSAQFGVVFICKWRLGLIKRETHSKQTGLSRAIQWLLRMTAIYIKQETSCLFFFFNPSNHLDLLHLLTQTLSLSTTSPNFLFARLCPPIDPLTIKCSYGFSLTMSMAVCFFISQDCLYRGWAEGPPGIRQCRDDRNVVLWIGNILESRLNISAISNMNM